MVNKEKQLELILKVNPMNDDYHVGIRTLDDIKTYPEAVIEEPPVYPDWTTSDAHSVIAKGKIKVYSSYPIKPGTFVTPSEIQANEYAGNSYNDRGGKITFNGNGKVYSKEIPLDYVAWINGDEGIYCGELTESIVANPSGGKDVLFSYKNQRCHAEIVDKVDLTKYKWFGKVDDFTIYKYHSVMFDPFGFVAVKEGIKMEKVNHVIDKVLAGASLTEAITNEQEETDTYYCDGQSSHCLGEIPYSEVNWFTSSIGFCEMCNGRLHRHPQKILDFCYDCCEGGDDEIAEFVIGLTE